MNELLEGFWVLRHKDLWGKGAHLQELHIERI